MSKAQVKSGVKELVTEMTHGDRALTVRARLAITQGGGNQIPGMTKLMAGFAGFIASNEKHRISQSEYEIWDCEIIIVPKRIYRKGPFKGHRIDQVLTDLHDIENRFERCEDIPT